MSNWVENSRFAYILQHQGAFAHGGEELNSDLPCLGTWRAAAHPGGQSMKSLWSQRGEKISIFQSLMQSSVGTVCQVVALYQKKIPFPEKYASSDEGNTLYPKAQSSRDYWPYSSVRNYNSKERWKYFTQQSLPNLQKRQKNQKCGPTLFFLISQQQARHHI